MAKIPLNKFRNRNISVSDIDTGTPIYEAPLNRATIIMNVQATNITSGELLISLYTSNDYGATYVYLVKDFPIPGNDARSLISGRVILQGVDGTTEITVPDRLYALASGSGIDLSVSLLETVNKN